MIDNKDKIKINKGKKTKHLSNHPFFIIIIPFIIDTGKVEIEDLDILVEMDNKTQNYDKSKKFKQDYKKKTVKCDRCLKLQHQ